MNQYNISVKVDENKFETFQVPFEVYRYILQLEAYIKYPEKSRLKEIYRLRFGNGQEEKET